MYLRSIHAPANCIFASELLCKWPAVLVKRPAKPDEFMFMYNATCLNLQRLIWVSFKME